MNVDENYLKRFSSQIHGHPSEFALNGYEQTETHVIAIDDPDETYLAVSYRDEYESPYDVMVGTDKRETIVIPKRAGVHVGLIGYRFAGLILPQDLRSWYRRKFELEGA